MPVIPAEAVLDKYDLVVAGTGFGSLFFVDQFLKNKPGARVLMVEWGSYRDTNWQLDNRRNADREAFEYHTTQPGEKPWNYTIGYGGGTNCWWANTPRMAPNDFRTRSLYGVGDDWPIGYADIEPYYLQAEQIMAIAGPNDLTKRYPRSGPFPQPAHTMSAVDKVMKSAMPDHHFATPNARLRLPKPGRSACCLTSTCHLCPMQAKFTALNTFGHLLEDPRIDVIVNSRVLTVEHVGGVATGLRFRNGTGETTVSGELVAVGCNAIQTPFILKRSGLDHPVLGKYLHEKRVMMFEVELDGVDNFDGGVPSAGINTTFVDGEHRREAGGALIYFVNNFGVTGLRTEFGKWRQTLALEIWVEDIPLETNRVEDVGDDMPAIYHAQRSDYCLKGAQRVIDNLPSFLSPLPVERIIQKADSPTGNHVQGTCRMGSDPDRSIVDGDLVHHRLRNLLVLGTSVWPSCGTANPSLTAAALSLRAADRIGA